MLWAWRSLSATSRLWRFRRFGQKADVVNAVNPGEHRQSCNTATALRKRSGHRHDFPFQETQIKKARAPTSKKQRPRPGFFTDDSGKRPWYVLRAIFAHGDGGESSCVMLFRRSAFWLTPHKALTYASLGNTLWSSAILHKKQRDRRSPVSMQGRRSPVSMQGRWSPVSTQGRRSFV